MPRRLPAARAAQKRFLRQQMQASSDPGCGRRSTWPERGLALVAIGTLVVSIFQTQAASRQSEVATAQLESTEEEIAAGQRAVDLEMLGDVSVAVAEDSVSITNRSTYPLIDTGVWAVADDYPQFQGLLIEVNGVPACSQIDVPLEGYENSVGPVDGNPEATTDMPWLPFEEAFIFFTGPSGNWYSTSVHGGIVDHNRTEWRGAADPNYGDIDSPAFWEDINVLIDTQDTFWEYSEVQLAKLDRMQPLRPGQPLIGGRDEIEIEELDCS